MVVLKAEYGVGAGLCWHILPEAGEWALCHRLLSPIAESRPITDMTEGRIEAGQVCQICRTSFERGTETKGSKESSGSD